LLSTGRHCARYWPSGTAGWRSGMRSRCRKVLPHLGTRRGPTTRRSSGDPTCHSRPARWRETIGGGAGLGGVPQHPSIEVTALGSIAIAQPATALCFRPASSRRGRTGHRRRFRCGHGAGGTSRATGVFNQGRSNANCAGEIGADAPGAAAGARRLIEPVTSSRPLQAVMRLALRGRPGAPHGGGEVGSRRRLQLRWAGNTAPASRYARALALARSVCRR
jgi:hypothetical protein